MSFEFDLSIENYSPNELEDLFGLVNDNYDSKAVEISYIKLKKDVFSDDSVDKTVYAKTIDFLNDAKKILLFELNTSYNNSFKKRYDKLLSEKPDPDDAELVNPNPENENKSVELIDTNTQTDIEDSVKTGYPYPNIIKKLREI